MKFNTPLRYQGGRDKLAGFMKMVFEKNNLLGGHYVESSTGGAAIALNLLTHGYVSCIHLNDANPAVYAFWSSVVDQPEALCKAIHDVKITREEWQRQSNILNFPENHSLLEVGFSIFFLTRINPSGILWGVTDGGESWCGHWRADARFNKIDLIRRIEWIALHRSNIRLYNLETADIIRTVLPLLPDSTLMYMDFYSDNEKPWHQELHVSRTCSHLNIADLIKTHIKQYWIASFSYTPQVMEVYKSYPFMIYQNARDRYKSVETLFFSEKLIIPNLDNSLNLKSA